MKEANYIRFRQILSDSSLFGDEVLALMKEQGHVLGLPSEAFNMVYEGFWDLYCKKPDASAEIPVKKIEGFLGKVKLITPPADSHTDEEGNTHLSPAQLPLKAIIRIRIPLIRPKNVPEKDDETPEDVDGEGEGDKTAANANSASHEHQQLSTHPDEDTSTFKEMPIDDRAILLNNVSAGADPLRVWVLHQASQRLLRRDIALTLKKSVKELDEIENAEEFVAGIEEHAVHIEKQLVRMFSWEDTQEYDEVR